MWTLFICEVFGLQVQVEIMDIRLWILKGFSYSSAVIEVAGRSDDSSAFEKSVR